MLQDANHAYWLYGTHNTLATSTDMATFTAQTSDFSTSAEPSWWSTIYAASAGSPDMWAPSLLYDSTKKIYYQYYAMPVEPDSLGGEAIIALATSSSPSGPWTDKGIMIVSWTNTSTPTISGFGFSNTTAYNAIDPAPYVDGSGNWWLVFGSWFDGTHIAQLNPSTGLLLTTGTNTTGNMTSAAYRYWGEEGPFIYPYVVNGTQYYYYFAPINACCATLSPYRIIYGRSTSPTGPFLDRGGVDLRKNGGTVLLSTHGSIVGPGGQSVFTDVGSDGSKTLPTLVYHYDGNNNGTPTLGLNRLAFTSDGWPYVQ
jgi:arabinan endo-1,5-alpha-L-arabinosidase